MTKVYLLYDSRYRTNPDKAICFEVCDTFREASENAPDYGNDTVIVEFEDHGKELKNPKILN